MMDLSDHAETKPWPWLLHRIVGTIFSFTLTAMIVTVCLLQYYIQRNNGKRPSVG
jgi:hypothetical protein